MIDLAEIQGGLFAWGDPAVGAALERVFAADVLVVASPVYKATYTGLLKAFGDQISQGQLNGKLALPVMMGGADNHALAVEHQLRPLLVELGATCATPGLYVLESRAEERTVVAGEYIARLRQTLRMADSRSSTA
jgi:FMN reductase